MKENTKAMKTPLRPLILFSCIWLMFACKDNIVTQAPDITETLPASTQRSGDAAKGYQYLIYGDYVDGGIPYDLYVAARRDDRNFLNRTGDNAIIGHVGTAITTGGVRVVGANCLACHAESINGQFIIGLGNNTQDYTQDQTNYFTLVDGYIKNKWGEKSPQYDAYFPFKRGFSVLNTTTLPKVQGVNVADRYAAILAAHRNPKDLTWIDKDQLGIPAEVVPTDVPAWWLLKKKNTMFFTAAGTGDFARIMMTSGLVSLKDSTRARQIDNNFPDVLAYIKSLPSPKYKGTIDQTKALAGKTVFESNCSKCHGNYGTNTDYPNLWVAIESIGTDAALLNANFSYSQFIDWYNGSWFAQGKFGAKLNPKKGYVAPPLDGVWATAPYLHNGSVPTLEDLLNSGQRPKYWKRSFDNSDYDNVKIGWKYSSEKSKTDNQTYDTSLNGYGNQGHIYGDKLSASDRSNLIEYLKQL